MRQKFSYLELPRVNQTPTHYVDVSIILFDVFLARNVFCVKLARTVFEGGSNMFERVHFHYSPETQRKHGKNYLLDSF